MRDINAQLPYGRPVLLPRRFDAPLVLEAASRHGENSHEMIAHGSGRGNTLRQ
jgi:hypothetical protein